MTLMDLFRLDDKVAIVTGASSGLGVASPSPFAEAGADVVLGARRVEKLGEAAELVAPPAAACTRSPPTWPTPSSASRWSTRRWRSSVGSTCSSTTPASAPPCPPPARRPSSSARSSTSTSTAATGWRRPAAGSCSPGSTIINISSILGITTGGLPQAAYSASKAGLGGLTRDLAQQWTGRKGIRVNALAPGFFASEMTDTYPDGYLDLAMLRVPAGRKGDPRELAATAVLLASDAAGYVTGQMIPVDGGLTIA